MTSYIQPPIYASFVKDELIWKNWFQSTWNENFNKVSKAGDDMSGNLAVRGTRSPWATTQSAIDLNTVGHIRADGVTVEMGLNVYFDGANWRFKTANKYGALSTLTSDNTVAYQDYWTTTGTGAADALATMALRWRITSGGYAYLTGGYLSIDSGGHALYATNQSVTTGYATQGEFKQWNTAAGATWSRVLIGQVSSNVGFLEVANQANVKGRLAINPYGGQMSLAGLIPTNDAVGGSFWIPGGAYVNSMWETMNVGQNLYFDGANWRFATAGYASILQQYRNSLTFYNSVANGAQDGVVTLTNEWGIDGNSDMTVTNYSQLGSGNVFIKIKELTGTTANAQGGSAAIAHGLNSAKIISVVTHVWYNGTITNGVLAEYSRAAGYQYSVYFDGTYVYIENAAANSANILSKPVTVCITYKK